MIKVILMKRTYESGQIIFKDGDPGTEAILILKGYVSICKTEGNRTVEVATRGPGQILGEMSLMDDRPHSATVVAKGNVVAEIVTRKELKEMLAECPEPLVRIIYQLLERVRETTELAALGMSR